MKQRVCIYLGWGYVDRHCLRLESGNLEIWKSEIRIKIKIKT